MDQKLETGLVSKNVLSLINDNECSHLSITSRGNFEYYLNSNLDLVLERCVLYSVGIAAGLLNSLPSQDKLKRMQVAIMPNAA